MHADRHTDMAMEARDQQSPRMCAVFGDIVGSRAAGDRAALQARLLELMAEVNQVYAAHIAAPFRMTAGDEFHGLLKGQAQSWRILMHLREELLPWRARFAVGVGEVSTALSDDVGEMDGPCFHRAAAAMAILKNRKQCGGRQLLYSTDDAAHEGLLNTTAFLVTSLMARWTPAMRRAANLTEQGLTRAQAAEDLKVSPQAVAKSLRAASWEAVRDGEALLARLLEEGDNNSCRLKDA